MSIPRDLAGAYVPVRSSRRTPATGIATLGALNSEQIHACDGDESAIVHVASSVASTLTLEFSASIDGIYFFPVLAYPLHSVASTALPVLAQPLITDAIAVTASPAFRRVYCVRVAQFRFLKTRISAYTAGSVDVITVSDAQRSSHPYVNDRTAATLVVSTTAAVGVALTATLPAVPGLRHYIDRIKVLRFATALLTAAAAPVLVTTTNIPGALNISLPADAAAAGSLLEVREDLGSAGLATTAINTASTIVCPATAGVIWRVTAIYRIGI